jgi:hypothetical protein
MHLWDLPAGDGAFVLTGSAAARATFLDRAGAPLVDIEAVPGDALRLAVPAAANRLAVSCLGEPPPGLKVEPGPGAVTLAAAAPGRPAAVGWQDAPLWPASGECSARGDLPRAPLSRATAFCAHSGAAAWRAGGVWDRRRAAVERRARDPRRAASRCRPPARASGGTPWRRRRSSWPAGGGLFVPSRARGGAAHPSPAISG